MLVIKAILLKILNLALGINGNFVLKQYTLTKAQNDITVGNQFCYTYGKLCFVSFCLQDPTPAANAAVLTGFPKPKYYLNIGVGSNANGSGFKLSTSPGDRIIWDGTTTNWVNVCFAYIIA